MARPAKKNLSLYPEDLKLLDQITLRLGLDGLNAGIAPSAMGASWLVRALVAYAAERYQSEPPSPGTISPFSAELLAALDRHNRQAPDAGDL